MAHASSIKEGIASIWLREKGDKLREIPCHHNLETCLRAHLDGGGISAEIEGPLFCTIGRTTGQLATTPFPQCHDQPARQRRRHQIGNHTFRATDITYLKNGGTLENAAAMPNRASTRTTQLYDRRRDEVDLDKVEMIAI